MKWIINNLKMNLTLPDIIEYETKLSKIQSKHKIIVCPSFPYLSYFNSSNYYLGSQDVSNQESGSLTGEVSAKQLKSLNVKYTIIGHSERKKELSETNNQVSGKIKRLFENDITPILCIGELNKNSLTPEEEIKNNLEEIFKDIIDIKNIIIAYEPVWSIGTGDIPSNNHIEKVVEYIKKWFYNRFNICIDIIYGGSVSINNIQQLNNISNIDGYLLGGTSLRIDTLKEIIKCMEV